MKLLIKRAKRGDKVAFVELMKENELSLYKVAKSILRNDEDVAMDRNNNNQIYSIKFKEKYKDELEKIKAIDMWSENNVELMIDQAVEIDLTN